MKRAGVLRRVSLGVGVLFGLLVVYWMFAFRAGPSRSTSVPRSERGYAYLLVDGRKYLLHDRDRDGRVDCIVRTGLSGFVGHGVLEAPEARVRCSRLGLGSRTMGSELRRAASRLAALKLELDAAHTSGADLDSDGALDCLVSVHDPDLVVLEAPDSSYAELFLLEQSVRSAILDRQ